MFTLRRWYEKYGWQFILTILAIGGAWFLKETKGAMIMEFYQSIYPPSSPPKQAVANAKTQELESRVIELEKQNQELKKLLGYIQSTKKSGILSPIIGRSADNWWEQVTIGKGSKQGIKSGSVVVGTGGLIGRVISVTPNTSRVLLITDPTSRVGTVVSRTRLFGYIRGQGNNRVVMRFLEKVPPDVKKGDVITTSSLSQLFPPGIPIGKVESIDLNQSSAPQANIKILAPVESLEWVVVYPTWENQPVDQSDVQDNQENNP